MSNGPLMRCDDCGAAIFEGDAEYHAAWHAELARRGAEP